MQKRVLVLSALAAAVAFGQPKEMRHIEIPRFGGGPVGIEAMMGGTVKGQPYSADVISESIQVLADGNRIVNRNTAFAARDSQGRTRHEAVLNVMGLDVSGAPKIIMIHDPLLQVTYTLDDRAKMARKMSTAAVPHGEEGKAGWVARGTGGTHVNVQLNKVPGGDTVHFIAKEPGKSQIESLGSKMIEGVMADGKRITETIPAGEIGNDREIQIVNEVWTAQDLRAIVYSKRTDPRTGEMIYRLANIRRGDPPASLFDVPADYQVQETLSDKIMIMRTKD